MMNGKKVRVNVHDAVEALVTGGKIRIRGGGQVYMNRMVLKRMREALKAGDWMICPRY